MSNEIKIANAVSGHGRTSLKRAERYVRKGQAEWVKPGVLIRFVESDFAHKTAARAARISMAGYDRAAAGGLASRSAMASTPIVAPDIALGCGNNTGARPWSFKMIRGPRVRSHWSASANRAPIDIAPLRCHQTICATREGLTVNIAEIPAKAATAPRHPPAILFVKRDESQPWSEGTPSQFSIRCSR